MRIPAASRSSNILVQSVRRPEVFFVLAQHQGRPPWCPIRISAGNLYASDESLAAVGCEWRFHRDELVAVTIVIGAGKALQQQQRDPERDGN